MQTFTDCDFEEHKITSGIENRLVDYVIQIQQAMLNMTITDPTEIKFTSNYIARGMGLIAGDEKRKNTFFIYRNSTFNENDNIFLSIRGPYNTYGRTTIQAFASEKLHLNNKKYSINSKFFGNFDFSSLINNNKAQENSIIPIQIQFEANRTKVTFIPQNAGVYEICLVTNGAHLMGSPYNVQILENMSGVYECFDDEKKAPPKKNLVKKRIVSQVINFVNEEISYEEYENYKRECREKIIKQNELLIEKERRDSSLDLNKESDNANELNNNTTKTELIISSTSTESDYDTTQINKMNFFNSTLSDSTKLLQHFENVNNDKVDCAINETSPICKNHIEQEVPNKNTAEKRENFQKSRFNHKNDSIRNFRPVDTNKMRILSVLECLKRDNSYNYITTSLPNLSNNEDVLSDNYRMRSNSLDINEICSIRIAYKERKAYWTRLLEEHKNQCNNKITNRKLTPFVNKIKMHSAFSFSANDVSHAKEKTTYTKNENLIFPSIQERKAIFSSETNINETAHYNKINYFQTQTMNKSNDSLHDKAIDKNEIANGAQDFVKHKERMKERFVKAQIFFKNLEHVKKVPKQISCNNRKRALINFIVIITDFKH